MRSSLPRARSGTQVRRCSVLALFGGALVASGLSCAPWPSRQSKARPVASLADTTAAGRTYERLHVQWARNEPADRFALRKNLDAFVEQFPKDGKTPLVRIYGALSLMDPPADWGQAERRLENFAPPPPGAAHDLYVIAIAKLRRYHHEPEAAFELLRPIVGNVIDARARGLLQEELTFDALEAREPYEAIAYMDAWLRGASEEDRKSSEAKVSIALGAVPEAALRGSLEAMRTSAKGGESHGYGVVIQRLVTERLGQVAIDRGDAPLARWLLDSETGASLIGEEISAALVQLATSRRGIGAVAGRTVGLVLPTSSAALRDEVADVLRGVLWALGIGREAEGSIHLVTRDDGGDAARLRLGMDEVAGEGASVIITALDAESAKEARAWAATSSIDVIVLAAPPVGDIKADAKASGGYFSVGEDWDAEVAALVPALLRGRLQADAPIALLADSEETPGLVTATAGPSASAAKWETPVSCDLAPTVAGESRFPIGAWQKARVDRWLVAGSAPCADDLLRGLGRRRQRGAVALSLEASGAEARPLAGLRVATATAGIVPVALADSADARVRDARAMMARTGAPAAWWTALGHDAATLARTAITELPDAATSDPAEIARRHALVHQRLIDAQVELWTSEQKSFDSHRTLPRAIRVVDLVR